MVDFPDWLKRLLSNDGGARHVKVEINITNHVTNVTNEIVGMSNPTFIDVSKSDLGLLNTGSIRDVESINVNVGSLRQQGQEDLAEALKGLTEAVVKSQELESEPDKQDLLDQIDLLAQQANIRAPDRKMGLVKAAFNFLAAAGGAAGGFATAWATWGPVISKFFGV